MRLMANGLIDRRHSACTFYQQNRRPRHIETHFL